MSLANLGGGFGGVRTRTTATDGAVRELTAEQLAGSISRGGGTPTPATNGRPRRNRRPRRTPSQISTTSLPAYNKEPGDEEVVIFRSVQLAHRDLGAYSSLLSVVHRTWRMQV